MLLKIHLTIKILIFTQYQRYKKEGERGEADRRTEGKGTEEEMRKKPIMPSGRIRSSGPSSATQVSSGPVWSI